MLFFAEAHVLQSEAELTPATLQFASYRRLTLQQEEERDPREHCS